MGWLGAVGMVLGIACGGGGSAPAPAVAVVTPDAPDPKVVAAAELEKERPGMTGAIVLAEERLAAREGAAAKSALGTIEARMKRFRVEPGAAALGDLGTRYDAAVTAAAHMARLQEGLALARNVVADQTRCDTGLDVSNAWEGLKATTPADPEWKAALALTAKLEKCRARMEKTLTAGLKEIMTQQRRDMAAKMERTFLDQGMDVRVTLSGTNKDQIKMTWILMSRVTAHQLTDGGSVADGSFLGNLQKVGFRKVTFYDGYNESYTYTLEPADESQGGKLALAPMGLGAPLKLGG